MNNVTDTPKSIINFEDLGKSLPETSDYEVTFTDFGKLDFDEIMARAKQIEEDHKKSDHEHEKSIKTANPPTPTFSNEVFSTFDRKISESLLEESHSQSRLPLDLNALARIASPIQINEWLLALRKLQELGVTDANAIQCELFLKFYFNNPDRKIDQEWNNIKIILAACYGNITHLNLRLDLNIDDLNFLSSCLEQSDKAFKHPEIIKIRLAKTNSSTIPALINFIRALNFTKKTKKIEIWFYDKLSLERLWPECIKTPVTDWTFRVEDSQGNGDSIDYNISKLLKTRGDFLCQTLKSIEQINFNVWNEPAKISRIIRALSDNCKNLIPESAQALEIDKQFGNSSWQMDLGGPILREICRKQIVESNYLSAYYLLTPNIPSYPELLYEELYGLFLDMEANQMESAGVLPQNFKAILWYYLSLLPQGNIRNKFGAILLCEDGGFRGSLTITDVNQKNATLCTAPELLAILKTKDKQLNNPENKARYAKIKTLISDLGTIIPAWGDVTLKMPFGADLGIQKVPQFAGKIDEVKLSLHDEQLQEELKNFGVKSPFVLLEALQPPFVFDKTSFTNQGMKNKRNELTKEVGLPPPKFIKPK